MNFLLVIYSCRKYIFMKDYYVDKYKKMGYDVIFVFADPNLEGDAEYVYDKENNMVVLKCEDDFEHLPNKTYFLTKIILNSSRLKNYDYIIKMDDDTEFNINCNNLIEMIETNVTNVPKENIHYIGPRLFTSEPTEHDYHFGKCTNNIELNITPFELKEKLSWGCGFFYILSRHALTIINGCITNNLSILQDFLYEDMMIGKIMSENEIKYETLFTNNVITDLKRPRTSSINKLFIEQGMDSNYRKISYMGKSMSKIKKVTINFNKTENMNNYDDNLSDKIKTEINTNRELDKKIKELSHKLNNNTNTNTNTNINTNTNSNRPNNTRIINTNTNTNANTNATVIKKQSNPIIMKSSKKNTSKIMIRR